jgi:Fe-S cluster assembly protein SufD
MAVTIPLMNITELATAAIVEDPYLMGLLKLASLKEEASWLKEKKSHSAAWLARLQTPNKNDEEWRFTDLSSLISTHFVAPKAIANPTISSLTEADNTRLVFCNGIYSPELSTLSGLPQGVFVGSLEHILDKYPVERYFDSHTNNREVFATLNTAGFENAGVIWIEKNAAIATPIRVVFLSQAEEAPSFSQPRLLVVAQANTEISLIEEYVGEGNEAYFTNAVTEIYLEDNARVIHNRIQQENKQSFHIGTSAISQGRSSSYTCVEINLGGKLSRHNLQVLQTGEQTETYLQGLTFVSEEQLADTHSTIALTKPHGTTDQLHKCIVDDSARAVFNGKIFVPKTAQLTNAAQLNRNLLLSPRARIDTKPELQITADNVKCSHGATVSQLEPEEVFYLRSRGLTDLDARYLLIDAFATEIIAKIFARSLREKLIEIVNNRVTV